MSAESYRFTVGAFTCLIAVSDGTFAVEKLLKSPVNVGRFDHRDALYREALCRSA